MNNIQYRSNNFSLADAGHSVTILETNEKKEASNFGHGITTEHIYIPAEPRRTQVSVVLSAIPHA